MVMDEYGRMSDEFHIHSDEYNRNIVKRQLPKKKKRNNYKAIKCLCASSVVLLSYPMYFDIMLPETKAADENITVVEEVNNNQNIVNEIIDDNPIEEDEPPNENIDNPLEEVKVEMIEVECELCEGTGIICPGDPTFGYDRGNGYGYEGCHGTGYSICPDIWCHDGVKTCQNCEGSGVYKGEFCLDCQGSGIVDCEFCNNTGIAECISIDSHVTCDKCDGNGFYLVEK